MHPAAASWAGEHGGLVESRGDGACRDCHGGDLRGTVLPAALASRTFDTGRGTFSFPKGTLIGCDSCHNSPYP